MKRSCVYWNCPVQTGVWAGQPKHTLHCLSRCLWTNNGRQYTTLLYTRPLDCLKVYAWWHLPVKWRDPSCAIWECGTVCNFFTTSIIEVCRSLTQFIKITNHVFILISLARSISHINFIPSGSAWPSLMSYKRYKCDLKPIVSFLFNMWKIIYFLKLKMMQSVWKSNIFFHLNSWKWCELNVLYWNLNWIQEVDHI